MRIHKDGIVTIVGIIDILLLTGASKLESIVLKPVVPNFCQSHCDQTVGQSECVYTARDLSCHYITDKTVSGSSANEEHNFTTAKDIMKRYSATNMQCPSDELFMTNGSHVTQPEGRGRAKPAYEGHVKKSCVANRCKAPDTPTSPGKDCILLLRENITVESDKELIKLPLTIKPGMKLTVYGGYIKGTSYAQLSFTKDANNPANMFQWMHVIPTWSSRSMTITEGMTQNKCKVGSSFPISDPAHFDLTLELSSSSTKIYADRVLVWTLNRAIIIKEFYIRRYHTIHRLVVQKTGDGCDEVD